MLRTVLTDVLGGDHHCLLRWRLLGGVSWVCLGKDCDASGKASGAYQAGRDAGLHIGAMADIRLMGL